MSVLKSLDTDLPKSEKKSLYRFLSLYLFFTVVVLALTASLYYTLQKELAAFERTILLDEYTNEFMQKLEELQNDTTNSLLYPQDKRYESSLYGSDYKLIYSTLENPNAELTEVIYSSNKLIRYVSNPQRYYLNTQYVVVEMAEDLTWLNAVTNDILLYGGLFFLCMTLLGYYLVKLFLKPMRDAILLLDTFIQDTTHELNTPVSTILNNIELIEKERLHNSSFAKNINRIEIGAKTISNIYDDLTYLVLNNKIISRNEEIALAQLVEERIEYFGALASMKKIEFTKELKSEAKLFVDLKKLSKLIDNLLSNAIKYNKIGGTITVKLYSNSLCIKDSGRGIQKEQINAMFERYTRFEKSVGGFGIGLSIVKMICDEYRFEIKISSEVGLFTEVCIKF